MKYQKMRFDEVEQIQPNCNVVLCLKEKYIDNYDSVNIALEVNGNEADVELLKYNLIDNTYEVVPYDETPEEREGKFMEIVGNSSNRTSTAEITEIKGDVGLNIWNYHAFEMQEDTIEVYVVTLPATEVTRIQGTLVIKE